MNRHFSTASGQFQRGSARPTVEALEENLRSLVRERQQLRTGPVDARVLEHSRLQIVHVQWQLGYALIDRYLPPQDEQAAA